LILPEFIVIENDPLALMDMHEIIVGAYRILPVSLGSIDVLPEVLGNMDGAALVIASISLGSFAQGLPRRGQAGPVAAVLIGQDKSVQTHQNFTAVHVAAPFSSDRLLAGIRSAILNLQ